MTEQETKMNRKLFQDNNLIHSVVNCDYKSVKKILDTSDYDSTCINDIGGFTKDVPIFILSVCYDIILNPDDYTNMSPFLKSKYEENRKILKLFETQFGFKNDNILIEDYVEYFVESEEEFLEEPEPAKTFEEFFESENLKQYENLNIREIDLRLYYAVWELRSYYEIKKYCEAGANPEFTLPENESPLDYVATEIKHLDIEVRNLLKKPQKEVLDIWDISELAWCARHQQNYKLMLKYCK